MAFVHGHPRDVGWVKAHRRRPNLAEDGQLPLIAEPLDNREPDVAGPAEPAEGGIGSEPTGLTD